MPHVKGTPKTGGRQKGSRNKNNQALDDVKAILRSSLNHAHKDGAEGFFIQLAKDHPQTYAQIVSKLVPNALQVDMVDDVKVVLDFSGGSRSAEADEE